MPDLTASVPHQLTRAEAKRRIQERIGAVRQQHAALVTNLQETWTGDRLEFSLTAMGQAVSGHLTVDDQAVHLTVALPWLLRMLVGTLKSQIEQQGRVLLNLAGPRPTVG
jgi:hypothetical protein